MTDARGVTLLKRHAMAGVLLVLFAAGFGTLTWSDQLGDIGGDSAVYVLTARVFLGTDQPGLSELVASSQYPPLYPLFLALSGGASDLHLAHAMTTALLVASFAALYAWMLAIGVPHMLAAAGMAAFALLPGTLIQSLHLHSESLYLTCALAGLAVLARAPAKAGLSFWLIAAGLFAAAALARTAGIALLPALGVALWRARQRHWAWISALAVAPPLIWSLLHRSGHSYTSALVDEYAGTDLAALLRRIYMNVDATREGLIGNWVQTTALEPVVMVLLLLAAAGAAVRFARLEPDAWYLAAYSAILALWPYPGEGMRFAWVLCPVLIGDLAWAAMRVSGIARSGARPVPNAFPAAMAAALALAVVPGAWLNLQRYRHPVAEQYPELRHTMEWYEPDLRVALKNATGHVLLVEAIGTLGAQVPDDDCILSIKPALVVLYAARVSRPPPLPSTSPAEFDAGLKMAACGHALLLPHVSTTFRTAYYPSKRLGDRAAIVDEKPVWREGDTWFNALLVTLSP